MEHGMVNDCFQRTGLDLFQVLLHNQKEYMEDISGRFPMKILKRATKQTNVIAFTQAGNLLFRCLRTQHGTVDLILQETGLVKHFQKVNELMH